MTNLEIREIYPSVLEFNAAKLNPELALTVYDFKKQVRKIILELDEDLKNINEELEIKSEHLHEDGKIHASEIGVDKFQRLISLQGKIYSREVKFAHLKKLTPEEFFTLLTETSKGSVQISGKLDIMLEGVLWSEPAPKPTIKKKAAAPAPEEKKVLAPKVPVKK